jgi:hypothetical protein
LPVVERPILAGLPHPFPEFPLVTVPYGLCHW